MNPALDIDPLPNSPPFQTFPMSIKTASPLVFVAVVLLLLLLLCSIDPSVGDPRNSQATLFCGNRAAAPSDRLDFAENFRNVMETIASQVSSKRYAWVVAGTAAKSWVYASAECIDRLSESACDRCIAQCRAQILRCLPGETATRAGRIYLDGCHLRFDEYDFFGEAPGLDDRLVCSDQVFIGNRTAAGGRRRRSVEKSSMEGRPDESFFVTSVVGKEDWSVGGLGQCGKFVNKTERRRPWGMRIGRCLPKQQQQQQQQQQQEQEQEEEEEEARMLKSGCYMRYPIIQLHDDLEIRIVVGGGRHIIKLQTVFLILAILVLIIAIIFFGKRLLGKRRTERKQLDALAAPVIKSSLHFQYEMLESATNYFNSSNKIGQGGSGSVFKGVLLDGTVVAVKMLFCHTRQWEKFFNEVNLISKIDHKNLVKLLGCSITGPESLLVYEYVPNKCLLYYFSGDILYFDITEPCMTFSPSNSIQKNDNFLFLFLDTDRSNAQLLSWEMRYNIVVGTAEGLAYLHEESELRIIHRDIKLSNILLDENYFPKIADFGLARFLPRDRTHITTAVAGTLGYLAPEYLASGRLTEKADVYSFGVLLLEVVTGKRNSSRNAEQPDNPLGVLQMVWKFYASSRLLEAVDPALQGNFPLEKATRALHIGLLCVQVSAQQRPSMSAVVKMLKEDDPMPPPNPPPFLAENPPAAPKKLHSRHGTSLSSVNSTTISILEPR